MAPHTHPKYNNFKPETRKAVGKVLRNLRVNTGTAGKVLVLAEVSRRSGISTGTLSQAENGIRLTWHTIQGHVEACTGSKAKAKASLTLVERLFNQLQGDNDSGTTGKTVGEQASTYWSRSRTLKMPPGMVTHEEGLLCLAALREHTGRTLRALAAVLRERTEYTYRHGTLGQVINGKARLTPDHLRAILIACDVPEEQWPTWSRFFVEHDPLQHDESYWALGPTPERAADLRGRFAGALEDALSGVVVNRFTERAELDPATYADLFGGRPVPGDVIARVLAAVTALGIPRQKIRELARLAGPLQLVTAP
ncbi:hypothetical protein [Streptomyces chartreusis]